METETRSHRAIGIWLLICCGLVYSMVILGGVTRLTGSGLSMVDWNPIMGVLPPLNQQEWEQTFASYKQFPEYQKINLGMTLDEFKQISDVVVANRLAEEIQDISEKIVTRDLFGNDS